jgi:hypothetical protein
MAGPTGASALAVGCRAEFGITDPPCLRRLYFDRYRSIHMNSSPSIELYLSITAQSSGAVIEPRQARRESWVNMQ